MRDEFAKFYLTLRFSTSEIERLRRVTKERSSGLETLLSRVSNNTRVTQDCWNEAWSAV